MNRPLAQLSSSAQAADIGATGHIEVVPIADHLAEVLRSIQCGANADPLLFYEHMEEAMPNSAFNARAHAALTIGLVAALRLGLPSGIRTAEPGG